MVSVRTQFAGNTVATGATVAFHKNLCFKMFVEQKGNEATIMKKLISLIATGLARRNFSSIIRVSPFLTLAFASTGYPVPIYVLNTQNTVAVMIAAGGGYPQFTDSQSSQAPISDSLYTTNTQAYLSYPAGYSYPMCTANADLLAVSGMTTFNQVNEQISSSAYVESDLWFSPVTSQTATINIQYFAVGAAISEAYTAGNVSLLDVTSGNEVWNYGWDYYISWAGLYGAPSGINDGTPILFTDNSGSLTLDTDLNASDTYELIIRTGSQSGGDSEDESIQVTGLEPIPEPSALALICLGSLALALVRRHQR